ncbi:hypothetical protein A8135_14210 [Legionella jamestowniensis]|nr:hypothetical protein A8135_14210 [Legionella jamestowniensis]
MILFMSKEKIESQIPVLRRPISGIKKEDALSKKLRQFDNPAIKFPFPNASGIYINTNESGVVNTSKALTFFPFITEPVHVGFSGWHNFDIMAKRLSSRAFICDVNPENTLFLSTALKYIRLYEDKSMFIVKMTEFVRKYKYEGSRTNVDRESYLGTIGPKSIKFSFNVSDEYPYSDHTSILEEIALEEKRETSWLYTKERYAHIRKLALQDKIAIITEDICNNSVFFTIRSILITNFFQVDTLYVSNIGEWMFAEEQRTNFLKTIEYLLTDNETILIAAKLIKNNQENNTPVQYSISKKHLNEKSSLKDWFFSDDADEDMVILPKNSSCQK